MSASSDAQDVLGRCSGNAEIGTQGDPTSDLTVVTDGFTEGGL